MKFNLTLGQRRALSVAKKVKSMKPKFTLTPNTDLACFEAEDDYIFNP